MAVTLSEFSKSLKAETAFSVLARAKELISQGRTIIELEIGDSPFPSPQGAKLAAIRAIEQNQTRYCPSPGLPELRQAAAVSVQREFQIPATAEHVVIAPGAKPFEQFFCEVLLNPGDGVLVFSPHFPTYPPNILRRGARCVFTPLTQERGFRPDPEAVRAFLENDPAPKAIFLNSPHNPTGGIAREEDLRGIADVIRGRDIAVFSDEPYCHMVWDGTHHSIAAQEGMLEQCMAAYTFSKSYSMSGWRLGFAVCSPAVAERVGVMINTSLSCVPPFVQSAGVAALTDGVAERDEAMAAFRGNVEHLVAGLQTIPGVKTLPPHATFYAFPNVMAICNEHGITSHGLALYLLEGADDRFGVASLGGECFGEAGGGFLRLSCSETVERIDQALEFIRKAIAQPDRIVKYLDSHPEFRLPGPYE